MTLSSKTFPDVARDFASKPRSHSELADAGLTGWRWIEHPLYPALGYMSRSTPLSSEAPPTSVHEELEAELEDEDAAVAPLQVPRLTCEQSVVFSPTFQVPVFYFTIHDSHGAPLTLENIVRTPLLRHERLPALERTAHSLTPLDAAFPVLSQGEHPSTGRAAWYLHPCGLPTVMDELTRDADTEVDGLRWLELWFMVVGSVVDLRL